MRLFVVSRGEKIWLPAEAATRQEFSIRIGGYRRFEYQGNPYYVNDVKAEPEWSNPAPGALVGGLIGALGGPAGAIIGAIVGGAASGSPSEIEKAKVKRFNESYV